MTSARFGPVDPYCPTLPHAVGRAVGPGAGALADGPHSPGPACPDHDRDAERPNRSPPPRPGSGPVSPMPSARSGCAGSMPTVWRGLTIACPPGAPARTARRCAPRSLPWPSRSRRRSGTRLRCAFTLWTLERAFREREGTHLSDMYLSDSTIWTWLDDEGLRWKRQHTWFTQGPVADPDVAEKRGP